MKRLPPSLLLALPLLLSACIIGGGDPPCPGGNYDVEAPGAPLEQRNPETGSCEYVGGGGGGGGGTCGDWGGAVLEEAPQADFDWATCYQYCEGLDETTCLGTPACRAAYADNLGDRSFYECWGTAPSGPVQGGACAGLDAYECSRHDDCSAVHSGYEAPGQQGGFVNGIAGFQECIDENAMQGCYSNDECGEGSHCNADTECLPTPGCGLDNDGDGVIEPCDAACYGFCVPDDTPNPGSCTGDVVCAQEAPNCPVDTLPGVLNGCWSGYCIPVNDCQSVAECPSLGESECVLRSDCDSIYQGVDCTCSGDTCTCADWLFQSCEAGIDVMPAGA